jgi:hypothetical protein
MSVGTLSRILPPPPSPVEANGSWPQVEEALGIKLPDDFKEFIEVYGSGTIGHFLSVLNPFSDRPALNLLMQSQRQLDALRILVSDFGERKPYDPYPIPGGLLPVAITDNGDVIHWLTRGAPVHWTIVVNESRSPDYEEFGCNLTSFLQGILDGSIDCRAFPRSPFGRGIDFTVT